MTRRSIGAALLSIGLLFTMSCGIGASSLSQQQLQQFIAEKHIQPLEVEDVGGDVTVMLYKDTKRMGCYSAFARNGIEAVHSYNDFLNLKGDAIEPVSFVYDRVFYHDIVCLTINDKSIRTQAHSIKVMFSKNELSTPVKNNGDMIIYQNSEVDSSKITIIIYDSNQKELIRSPFW